jgi:hypothetical protein
VREARHSVRPFLFGPVSHKRTSTERADAYSVCAFTAPSRELNGMDRERRRRFQRGSNSRSTRKQAAGEATGSRKGSSPSDCDVRLPLAQVVY